MKQDYSDKLLELEETMFGLLENYHKMARKYKAEKQKVKDLEIQVKQLKDTYLSHQEEEKFQVSVQEKVEFDVSDRDSPREF